MSDIKQIWQQSKEEFNERAFERFVIKTGTKEGDIYPCSNETVEIELRLGIRDLQLKPLPELFSHDVEVYGENAYLMWEFLNLKEDWIDFEDNTDVDYPNIRRKQSAALPFDLERAKKGDIFETTDGWLCKFIKSKFNGKLIVVKTKDAVFEIGNQDLRMKYPPKVAR